MRRKRLPSSLCNDTVLPLTSDATALLETWPSEIVRTEPSLPKRKPYAHSLPPLSANPTSNVGWLVGHWNSI